MAKKINLKANQKSSSSDKCVLLMVGFQEMMSTKAVILREYRSLRIILKIVTTVSYLAEKYVTNFSFVV